VSRKRQIGTRIDDSGEIAEAWDEYKKDYENKSSAMRQLMRQGLGVDESASQDQAIEADPEAREKALRSMTVGAVTTLVGWLLITAGVLLDILQVTTGTLLVSGLIVVGIASTVIHLKWSAGQLDRRDSSQP
jgi:hypothetical protein